jgi:IclR family pca regulon transcriptional regulator
VGRVLLAGLGPDAVDRALASIRPERHTARTITARGELRAAVDAVRRQGWAVVDEELEVGLRSISVPLRSRGGLTLGALNVCAPTSRISMEALRGPFLAELLEASARIRAALP